MNFFIYYLNFLFLNFEFWLWFIRIEKCFIKYVFKRIFCLNIVVCDFIGEECDFNFIFWVILKCVLNLIINNRDKEREG